MERQGVMLQYSDVVGDAPVACQGPLVTAAGIHGICHSSDSTWLVWLIAV